MMSGRSTRQAAGRKVCPSTELTSTKAGRRDRIGNFALTPKQKAELAVLASMPDADIDTSEIPQSKEFPNPRRGVFSGAPNRQARRE